MSSTEEAEGAAKAETAPASARPKKSLTESRARRRILLWLFASGVVLRMLYFVEHAGSAFFRVPILDEAFYDAVARALAAGEPVAATNPAFRPLFYPGLLSVAYRFGEDLGLPLALGFQHLLGILTGLVIALLAMRLFGRPAAGAVAGGLYLLAGPPLYFEGELLITSFFTALGAGLLLVLASVRSDSGAWKWAAAGAMVGLMAAARANALILALAFPLAALLLPGATGRLRRLGLASSALAALLGTLVGAALIQEAPLGRFQLVAGGGGVNLYLGNKRGADGMVPRQDRHQSYGDTYRDSVQLFSYAVYREETGDEKKPPDASDVSRFWIGKTLGEIQADPSAWLGLMARKTLFLFWNHEIPNNKSYAFIAGEESRLLSLLPVRFWLLLALAGVGAVVLWRRRADSECPGRRSLALWLALYVALLGGAVILYFVNARYRLPLWPAFAVLAGGGGLAVLDLLRAALAAPRSGVPNDNARSFDDRLSLRGLDSAKSRLVALVVFVSLACLSLVNWLSVPPITPHRDYFFRSLAHSLKGQHEAALDDAERSVELEGRDAAAHFQLASMALTLKRLKLAEKHAVIAISLEPKEPRALNQLGIVLERRGRLAEAYQAYVRATQLGRGFSASWVNAGLLELRANAIKRAARSIKHAEELGDRSVALQCARAFLEIKRGRIELGEALLRGAIERDRKVAERLVREHEKPLRLKWGERSNFEGGTKQADPDKTDPDKTDPDKTDPDKTDPDKTDPEESS